MEATRATSDLVCKCNTGLYTLLDGLLDGQETKICNVWTIFFHRTGTLYF